MRTILALAISSLFSSLALADPPPAIDGAQIASPVSYQNLTIFPLVIGGQASKDKAGEYMILDEGMDKGLVKIHEKEGGSSVNQLTLENKSDKPLFLMAGEVVLGGQQDRIIGKNTIIPAKEKLSVPVFCVEHGRWSGKDKSFQSAKALAHTKLRAKAGYEDQDKVWKEVAEKTKKRKAESDTGTYRRVAVEKDSEKAIQPYIDNLSVALAKAPDADKTVGVVIAVNGRVVGIEQFASPALYAKMKDKLLRSYYMDAVDEPVAADAKPPTPAAIVDFYKQDEEAPAEVVVDNAAGKTEQKKGKVTGGSKVIDKQAPAKPVYTSKQSL